MNSRRFKRQKAQSNKRPVQPPGWPPPQPDEDEDERRHRILGQHPQYHRAIEQGKNVFEGGQEVNPAAHIHVHLVVENQILERNPAFVAEAAEELERAGMDAHEVRHRLAEIVAVQLHTVLSGQPFSLDQHRQAVQELLARELPGTRG